VHLAGLCYAELASSIPISGSAYTYTYATMGEFLAWIIGWDLVLEYAVGAATVGIAWSEYLNNLLVEVFHHQSYSIPMVSFSFSNKCSRWCSVELLIYLL
jgi:amino acid transporter